jgi:hypothetical protein
MMEFLQEWIAAPMLGVTYERDSSIQPSRSILYSGNDDRLTAVCIRRLRNIFRLLNNGSELGSMQPLERRRYKVGTW